MILYHFADHYTLKQMGSFDREEQFKLTHGLKRGICSMKDWERWVTPLPPNAVWLTSDPNADIFERPRSVRITVALQSSDRRLAHWLTYVRKHATEGEAIYSAIIAAAPPPLQKFYVYFGDVPPTRFRAVEDAKIVTDHLSRAKLRTIKSIDRLAA
jgi:hypothetical protein